MIGLDSFEKLSGWLIEDDDADINKIVSEWTLHYFYIVPKRLNC